MGVKRSQKEWEINFRCSKDLLSVMDTYTDDATIERCSVLLRNPIIFDNNVKDVKTVLPFSVVSEGGKTLADHLIGTSNIVLYIFKNGLHKKWETVDDFKNTLKTLNVLLVIPSHLNNKSVFKNGWQFKSNNINDCIKWNDKLKSVGIDKLICNETGEIVDIDIIWTNWYNKNKGFL